MKRDVLYLTEGEIAARVGLSADEWSAAATVLERQGLPQREPLFNGRRYWPACKAFLDKRYNIGADLTAQGLTALDGEERWNEQPTPLQRRRA